MADCTESAPEVRADDAARADIGGGTGERSRRAGEASSLGCSEDGGPCDREAGPDGGAAPTEEELEAQRKKLFDFEPRLSIAIPAYKTPERYLKEMLDSILAQTYTNWEVCIADGSPKGESLERVLRRYAEKDSRIRYRFWVKIRGSREIPTRPWIWRGGIFWCLRTTTTRFRLMRCMRW